MASPRRRFSRLMMLVLTFVLWAAVLFPIPFSWFHDDVPSLLLAATPPLFTNLALALILMGEWKSGTGVRKRDETPAEWEVISWDRRKPPGFDKRSHRLRRVIVVKKRHIRRLIRPTFVYQKRRALGLPELPPHRLNRRKPSSLRRRMLW